MQSYRAIFDIFWRFVILNYLCSIYFCVIIYYNGIQAFNKDTMAVAQSSKAYFEPKILGKTCYLKPEEGPCRGKITMYYFDPASKGCSTFQWGGCQGNGNRFDTYEQCTRACLSKASSPKSRPKWCSLTFDYGYCFGAVDRYFYDPVWKVCKKTIYSGCGGNKNNFYSLKQCESVCQFGNGWLKVATIPDKSGVKKVVIVNPTPISGNKT